MRCAVPHLNENTKIKYLNELLADLTPHRISIRSSEHIIDHSALLFVYLHQCVQNYVGNSLWYRGKTKEIYVLLFLHLAIDTFLFVDLSNTFKDLLKHTPHFT